MDGKICLMTDLARHVLLFRVYCLPTRWFSCTQLPYLGREKRRQTNSWLKLRWLQSHQESTHLAPRGQIFRHFYLFKTRELFILSVQSLFWMSTPSFCIYLSNPQDLQEVSEWTDHDSQLWGKMTAKMVKEPLQNISHFQEYHITSLQSEACFANRSGSVQVGALANV